MTSPVSLSSLGVTDRADRPAGLEKADAKPNAGLEEARGRRDAFGQFVGETFIGQMLKAMRQTVQEPAYFHGGSAEKQFQARLDAQLAQDLANNGPDGLADELFASSFPADAALLKEDARASLDSLNALRRR